MEPLDYRFKNQTKKIRQNITNQTHPIDYYNPLFCDVSDDFGTLHVSTQIMCHSMFQTG